MSTTYDIVCDTCKERCWVGQGRRLYGYKYISDFLHKHLGHALRFLGDWDETIDGYTDCKNHLSSEMEREIQLPEGE